MIKNEPVVDQESVSGSKPIVKNKPVFEGNTFAQWSKILQSNRDYKAQARALQACLAIMETRPEQKQILDGARVFMKTLDSKFGADDYSKRSLAVYQSNLYRLDVSKSYLEEIAVGIDNNRLLLRVFGSCDPQIVFEFLKAEIESGTDLSRQVLFNWSCSRGSSAFTFGDRNQELADSLAANFDKPIVRAIANTLMPKLAAREGEPMTQFQDSALGMKVKEFVLTMKPQKRIEVMPLALSIFPDDQQVLQEYQNDLLDPKLNRVFYERALDGNTWQVKAILLLSMNELVSSKSHLGSTKVDATTRTQRLATAADWLVKIVDGILADGEQQLLFMASTSNDYERHELYNTEKVTEQILQSFYEVGNCDDDPSVKQLLLSKLKKLKQRIVEDKDPVKEGKKLSSRQKRTARTLADLDYVIAVYQGDTPAELPPNSKLKVNKSE